MIVHRLLPIFVIAGMLTGCNDVTAVRHDVEVVKAYLRALNVPNSCEPPGTTQSRICYYQLTDIQALDTTQPDLYVGRIPKKVVQDGYDQCIEVSKKIYKDFPGSSFKCNDPANYVYYWYGFKIDGGKHNPALVDKDQISHFISVANSNILKQHPADKAVALTTVATR